MLSSLEVFSRARQLWVRCRLKSTCRQPPGATLTMSQMSARTERWEGAGVGGSNV